MHWSSSPFKPSSFSFRLDCFFVSACTLAGIVLRSEHRERCNLGVDCKLIEAISPPKPRHCSCHQFCLLNQVHQYCLRNQVHQSNIYTSHRTPGDFQMQATLLSARTEASTLRRTPYQIQQILTCAGFKFFPSSPSGMAMSHSLYFE